MNVIGLDLSLNGTGICVSDTKAFTIVGTSAMGDKRLVALAHGIDYYITSTRPTLAVLEGLPFGNNDRAVALVHGVARMLLARHDVPYAYVYPTPLKLFATGSSTADKGAMYEAAIQQGAPVSFDHDQVDAWWLRRTGLAAAGAIPVTDEQRAVLARVGGWPDVVRPYGPPSGRKAVIKKCGHKIECLKNGDRWLHPFNVAVCDKPPK